jgi:NADH-quinone oxidoreductase subunit C
MNTDNLLNFIYNAKIIENKLIISSELVSALTIIKEIYGFDLLKEIIAIDKEQEGVELIYNLYSTRDDEELKLSITVKNEVESVSQLFESAIADEKEIYDLFGINFLGHNGLKRLYMPEPWQGHPLKKDYKEEDERLSWNE